MFGMDFGSDYDVRCYGDIQTIDGQMYKSEQLIGPVPVGIRDVVVAGAELINGDFKRSAGQSPEGWRMRGRARYITNNTGEQAANYVLFIKRGADVITQDGIKMQAGKEVKVSFKARRCPPGVFK